MTVANTEIGAFINAQTEDTTPDGANDLVLTYDNSVSAVKKVKLNNLPTSGSGVSYAALQAAQLVNEIKGWPPVVSTGDLDALNLWWDKVGTPTTAPSVVAGNDGGITLNYNLVLKVVADAANEGLSQRFTYADEPRVKAGRVLSTLWAIWCVGGVGVTASLLNSSAEETAAAKVTAAAWTIVEVPNHTLAGTYCDIKLKTDGAGTFYAVPLGANIGTRGFPLQPRPLRWVDVGSDLIVNNVDPGAVWTDVDCTAATSNLCVSVEFMAQYKNSTLAPCNFYVRRNGSAVADTTNIVVGGTSTSQYATGRGTVILDDGQIFEYIGSATAGNTESVYLSLCRYQEWA